MILKHSTQYNKQYNNIQHNIQHNIQPGSSTPGARRSGLALSGLVSMGQKLVFFSGETVKIMCLIVLIANLFTLMVLGYARPVAADASNGNQGENRGEAEIRGVALDERNRPLANAAAIIPEWGIAVSASASGAFAIPIRAAGVIHVEISSDGYLTASTQPFFVKPGVAPEPLRIILQPAPQEEIVITGTATPKLYYETPVKTSVTTRNEIEKQGAATLADSLELVTGVRVENDCQNCNFNQVRINGMEGKYSQILIDGMPVISSLAGVYALEQIPANIIDRLEVVKGGGSSLYGGNAVAGVINVITRRPQSPISDISVSQSMIRDSPNSSVYFNTDVLSANQATYASFFTNYQNRDHMDYNGDGFSDLGELRNLSLGGNFTHEFASVSGKLRLGFASIFEDRRGGNKFELPDHMADISESCRTFRADFNVGWEQSFGGSATLRLDGAYSHTRRKSYYGSGQDANAYGQTTNPVFHGSLTYNYFAIPDHNLLAGVSFNSDAIRDQARAYNRTLDATYTDLGLFLQDEVEILGHNATLLAGVRLDKHSELEKLIFSPRFSFLYKGVRNITFRATASTGFRAPQVFDEDLHITQVGGMGMLIYNRDGLKEERSHGFTLDIDYGRQVRDVKVQFSVSGFYNRLNGVFTLEETDSLPNARVFRRFNGAGAIVYGLSVEAGFKWSDQLELFSGWTIQNSRLDEPEPDFGSRKLFRSPGVYGSVRADYTIRGWFAISAEMAYTGAMTAPHFAGFIPQDKLETTEPFAVLNLTLTKKISLDKNKRLTLTATLENLLDRYQRDLDRGMHRDAGYVYGPRFPRTIRLSAGYTF